MSVAAALFLLSGGLRTLASSGKIRRERIFAQARRARIRDDTRNLPKTGTGFVGIHGRLREIPEGDEKYSRCRSLFFYHSRMTGIYNSSFSSVSVRCRRAFSFKRRLTDTCVLGNLPKTGTGFVEIHGSLREIPEGDEKYSRYPARVKTLRTSKRWENIPQNRIKTGVKRETYPFLCEFLLCRWENFSCDALFLEFLHRLYRSLFFYHSRMTGLGVIFPPFNNDRLFNRHPPSPPAAKHAAPVRCSRWGLVGL